MVTVNKSGGNDILVFIIIIINYAFTYYIHIINLLLLFENYFLLIFCKNVRYFIKAASLPYI